MRSSLYECQVMHHRFSPKAHRFVYRLFFFAIDLDELATLQKKLRLFSVNRKNLYSFREDDFLPTGEPNHNPSKLAAPTNKSSAVAKSDRPASTLKERIVAFLAERGTLLDGGRVVLVTLPRVLGYAFNPVSFYFCYDRQGVPVAAVTEVTNTFHEMKPYFLGADAAEDREKDSSSATFRLRTPKHFYVSPFSDVDVAFDFTLRTPGDRLSLQIDDFAAGERTLTSTLSGPRRALNDRTLAWFSIKYPLVTLQIIGRIHWQALRLYLQKIPWFRKSARPADQRDLYRPHLSIASSSPES